MKNYSTAFKAIGDSIAKTTISALPTTACAKVPLDNAVKQINTGGANVPRNRVNSRNISQRQP